MKLKLAHKLILGFLVVALLSSITGYFAVNRVLTISLAIAVTGILTGFLISAYITKNLRKLEEAAVRIGKGELDTKIDVRSNDEIGQLAKAFKQMIADLKRSTVASGKLSKEITEHKKTEEMLSQSEQDWEDTFDIITDMITIHDKDFNLIRANKSAREKLGISFLEGAKERCFKYYHGTDKPPKGCPGYNSLKTGKPATFELFEPHLNRFIEIRAIPRLDGNNRVSGFIHVVRDITKRKKIEKQLEHKAFYDQLTNLPNRTLFSKYLEHVTGRTIRHKKYLFAVLFIDIDRFKIINDSIGHMTGDQLLVSVARRLETCIRPEDMISRFGGDEFAIFLENISDESDATHIADRIQKELSLPLNLSGHEVYVTASIGIALSSTGYKNEEDILRDADSAMYRAKALGRARYEIFDSRMHDSSMKLLQLEADLRRAVERNEFLVYYQPILSLASGKITGAEALIRWQHPKLGLILPMEFIPLAEETGLISTIGEWILRTACIQNKIWQDTGYRPMYIGVNFSARQFQRQDISELIKIILQESGLPAQFLNVEITESIAMEGHSIVVLNELTAMGVQTSIDDFGTGYSSLGYLKHLPINTIKIDRSFVKDISSDSNAKAIVRAIIAIAQNLKMKLVAEGVETEEQRVFLQSHHCDEMQGYLYSPPVPEKEFAKLLEKERETSPRT